jgi:hypothetical protein
VVIAPRAASTSRAGWRPTVGLEGASEPVRQTKPRMAVMKRGPPCACQFITAQCLRARHAPREPHRGKREEDPDVPPDRRAAALGLLGQAARLLEHGTQAPEADD